MGKKGSKRKTRWRTLSIGAPPGEEDEEEGLRKDYVKTQEKDANVQCTFDRNGQQSGYKPRRAGGSTSTSGGSTSGYASSGSRSHRDESAGSPSQPKIIFNEDEYTKITTPRQDVLFKKGYLSRKKPWTGNASTSATPSTTESQSASHSTADGSETTEDQQLLDRDSGTGEYPPMVEQPGAQVGYGAFYDHASGYYYEYPVMLVGPAPVPAQVGPSVLATVPCAPVPLRPIEWINPAFVPKLASQPYCLMDYQTSQSTESATIVEEQNGTMTAEQASSSVWNESGTGSASCSGSVAEEIEEQAEEAENATMEQHIMKEQLAEEQLPEQQHFDGGQHLENGMTTVDPYLDPVMMPEPSMHIPHVMPTVPQPYMYPGHYMFGPPLVNVNGVTIQGGPLVRTMDATGMTMACAKRRKKRKKRKQRRPTLGNTEDEEEGEYSSECDNEVSSSRLSWSECSTSTATTTMAANRPLNPECQEFQLRPVLQSQVLSSPAPTTVVATVAEEVMTSTNDSSDTSFCVETEKMYDTSIVKSPRNQEDATVRNSEDIVAETPLENAHLTAAGQQKSRNKNAEINGQANHLVADMETTTMNEEVTDHRALSTADNTENDAVSNSELSESNSNDVKTDFFQNNCVSEENLVNGRTNLGRYTDIKEKSISTNHQNNTSEVNSTTTSINDEEEENAQRSRHYNNSIVARTTTYVAPSKKYSKKGPKFVREPTPGPELDDATHRQDLENGKLVQQFEAVKLSDDAIADGKCVANNKLDGTSRETMNEEDTSRLRDNEDKMKTTSHYTTEGSNEDSGFESQTRLSEYPITAAVTEWLRRVNSPDLFVTSASTSDSETDDDDDDDEEMDAMPPKNLQGNPMPALSANSGVDTESRTASCGEFATANNNNNNNNDIGIAQVETDSTVTSIGRKKRDAKVTKRKKKAKRIDKQNRNVDAGKAQSQSISCNRMEEFVTAMRSKNTSKNNVGNVCEFTQKDSVAGMRVALNSRINSKGINVRRMKSLRKINKSPIENIDIKMRRIDDLNDERGEETDEDVAVSVRTFEKGEIIVSEDGRLLPTSSYKPVSFNRANYSATRASTRVDVINENADTRNSSENDENAMIASSVSIEEPDVLECWEAETIEPVITPRRMLQSPGVLCEGEAAEEDNFEIETITMEHIEKYYRLARDNAVSAEEESSDVSMSVTSSKSRTVPNNSEKMMEHFCSEEIPIIVPDGNRAVVVEDEKIPIDEAFEVYESYYNGGKSPFLAFNSKMFKQRPLYGQHGEGPIPCRAVCCNIQ